MTDWQPIQCARGKGHLRPGNILLHNDGSGTFYCDACWAEMHPPIEPKPTTQTRDDKAGDGIMLSVNEAAPPVLETRTGPSRNTSTGTSRRSGPMPDDNAILSEMPTTPRPKAVR